MVFLGDLLICSGTACQASQAAAAFGAFEWALFVATTVFAALHVFRTRGSSTTKAAPNMEIQNGGGPGFSGV